MTAALSLARAPYQRLVGPMFDSPEAVVSHFGCMQSQDFAMAKWAIAQRSTGLTDVDLDDAFGEGRFLRTHILRPTWHFVVPQDLGWIMALTAPRVDRLMATFNKTIDLGEAELDRAADIIVKALDGGEPLTRAQLAQHLADAGLKASGPRLAHLFIHSELRALICNGPIAGKQHTYVLAPGAVTATLALSEDEALARLARTYVRGHGPCQPADLSWWSSLTLTQSRRAFELAGLEPRTIDGQELWCDQSVAEESPLPRAALIPAFDESISYVAKPIDLRRFPGALPDLARGGGLLFVDGLIGGTWGRRIKSKVVEIDVRIHGPVPRATAKAIEAEAERYAAFLGSQMVLNITA
ncbi:MAG: winged helix DNA-binding domain-containing protein [Actinomycetota bacterium]|nr:winged helix DNA-binding domain-containing protein [Actinomycetota bacterium]